MYPNKKDVQYKFIFKKKTKPSQPEKTNSCVGLLRAVLKFSCFQQGREEEDLEDELVRLCQ